MKWVIAGIIVFIASVSSLILQAQQKIKVLRDIEKSFFFGGEGCYKGVVYIIYSHGITVKFTTDGKVEQCESTK